MNNSSEDCVTLDEDEYCTHAWDASWKELIGNQTFDSISEGSLELAGEQADLSMDSISDDSLSSSFSSLEFASLSDFNDETEMFVVIENDQVKQSSITDKKSIPNDIEIIVRNDQYVPTSEGDLNMVEEIFPIFASDGLINVHNDKIISVCNYTSSRDLIKEVKKIALSNGGLKRDIWLSIGNYEASLKCNPKQKSLDSDKWPKVINGVVDKVFSEIVLFEKEVIQAGGNVILFSLIPCPKLVDNRKSLYANKIQELGSRIFVRMNKEIKLFNTKRGNVKDAAGLHLYFEVKRRKSYNKSGSLRKRRILEHKTGDYYSGRDQRKIKTKLFKSDMVQLTDEANKDISKVCVRTIMNYMKKKVEVGDC